jgi:hypothetical protein
MVEQQGGGCAICHKPLKLDRDTVIDHDHATGRIRGVLCRKCNIGIGQLRDDPTIVASALAYLKGEPCRES